MKKIFAIVIALILALSLCAFAEDMSDWTEVELPDIQMHFYRPADMEVAADDELEDGMAYYASNSDVTVAVYCIETGESSADDVIAMLEENGMTCSVNALADAGLTYDHIFAGVEGQENYGAVIFMGADGYWYDFEAEAQTDDGLQIFGMMLGTLSPIA